METIAELVTAQVRRAPDSIALIDRDRRFTYCELDARANQVAHELAARGVGVETRVGVCCERTVDMVVALLGIVKAGGAYVPIDPLYPAERRELIVADAGLPVVVTQRGLAERFAVPTLAIDGMHGTRDAPRVAVRGDDALYVLYTSGSTGRPKGVVGLHGATASRLRWQQDMYPFAVGEVASARTTLGFVDSVAEIFAPLAFGVPLVVIGDAAQRDVAIAIEELAATCATRIVLVPSLLATMLDVMPDLARRVPDLRYWFVGGEPVPVPLVERFKRALPGRKLINIYGATELSADATYYDFDAMPAGLATSPIGIPLPGVFARIVDADLREVPDGDSGEIVISGSCLSRGYLERPELTAERFVDNPFPEGGRLYRTRDLGKRLPAGDIQYLGRLDQLVKIRGVRVELGEVEAIVGAAPGVVHAAAIARDDQLVAFYTSEHELPVCELRAFVASRLPAQLVPNRFVRLADVPRNANGKLDRAVLATVPLAVEQGEPPTGEYERRIAAIWCEQLGLHAIGRTQDCFEIGGTSLVAMRVAARLRETFDIALSVAIVLQRPTIASLATWVEQELANAPARDRRGITADDRPATVDDRSARGRGTAIASCGPMPASFPLSDYQYPFWMFRALTGGVSVVADAFAFAEPVDVERLQHAYSRTVARFDALWMRYPRFRPVQQLAPRREVRFDLSDDDVDTAAARNNTRTFDLGAPPHVHAVLVRRERLLVAMPHVAVDMASVERFRAALEREYYAEPVAPPAGATLFDLVAWERTATIDPRDVAHWTAIVRAVDSRTTDPLDPIAGGSAVGSRTIDPRDLVAGNSVDSHDPNVQIAGRSGTTTRRGPVAASSAVGARPIDPRGAAVVTSASSAVGSRAIDPPRGPRSTLNRLPARMFARGRERAWSTRAIEPATLARIEQFARRSATTSALALVGGIYAALARLADADAPTALVMIEKRDRAELRELFTNLTAIMPCRVAGARGAVSDVAARVAAQLLEGAEHTDPLMRHPTLWNDFWAGSPRAARLLQRVLPTRAAQYIRALVPLERKRDRVMFVINVLPEVMQSHTGERIARARELPHMLVPTDLVTGADTLLDRTLQVHVTNAGDVAVNLYGGAVSRAGLDEINDRIAAALGELA